MESVKEKKKMKAVAAAKEASENVKRANILENYNRSNHWRKQWRLEDSQNAREIDLRSWSFPRDSRLTIIRSEERQKLADIGGLNVEGLSVIDDTELVIPG